MEDADFFRKVSELIENGSAFAIATVVAAEGSTLAKPGFKLLLGSDMHVLSGSLGGGCPESALIPTAEETLKEGEPKMLKVHLEQSEVALEAMIKSSDRNEVFVETFCGGNLSIFIEPYLPKRRVILIGQGGRDSVEEALLEMLSWAGFSTVLMTPSPGGGSTADTIINTMETGPGEFDYRESDSVIVLTKGNKDTEILEQLSGRKLQYVGMLASRKRSAKDLEELRGRGVDEDFLSHIHTPIGLNINAVTPREIAVSIISEIIQSSNKKRI